ncbi:hypothetical protein GCM10009825_22410 [Arthrobacter humicola]|uniref:Uncharacterized protein n=1 Tax=Arthrobacter humicola TaxID=409291 RepID=A0ABP5KXD1_9MICC
MENPVEGTPPLVATPRHLRRRAFHTEIPDTLLVPGAEPLPLATEPAAAPTRPTEGSAPESVRSGSPAAVRQKPKSAEVSRQRKRIVALVIAILVALSIPALVLALIFAR